MTRTSSRLPLRAATSLLLAGLLSACGADPGVHTDPSPPGGTTSGPTPDTAPTTPPAAPAEPTPPAALRVAVQQFVCLGMVAPAQVRQRVTGGLTAAGEPVDVTFVRLSGSLVLAQGAEPQANPGYDGGYWRSTYGLDAWTVAVDEFGTTYTLLFPPGPYPLRFDAMAITDYLDAGNYQDQLTCGIL